MTAPFDIEQTGPSSSLPEGAGERARRRRRHRRERLLRRGGAGIGLAVTGALVVALIVWAVGVLVSGGGRGTHPATGAAARSHPAGALLIQRGPDGAASSVTLLAVDTGGKGGHVVFIPPATMTEVPSFQLDSIGHALRLGGPALVQATVENLLGVNLERVSVLDDGQLVAMVRAAGPLRVHLADRVEQVEPNGVVDVLWEQGDATLDPGDVPRFLAVRGQGTDLARLARQQAFWEAWLPHLRQVPAATAGVDPTIVRLASGDVDYDVLPVDSVGGDQGDEVYRVRQGEVDALVRQVLPTATAVGKEGRIRVQVLNGTGGVGVSQKVAGRLVGAGARVVLTGNADSFGYKDTSVVFYDRSEQGAAARVQKALGVGRLVYSRRPLDVVDVTVVVGGDFNG